MLRVITNTRWISFVLTVVCASSISAQSWKLVFDKKAPYSNDVIAKWDLPDEVADSTELNKLLLSLRFELVKRGHMAASVDHVVFKDDTVMVSLYAGQKYQWAYLKPGNVPEEYLNETGFREKFYTNRPFDSESLARFIKKLLDHCENNGYPFAEFKLDSILINDLSVSAQLWLRRNEFTVIDSVIVKGNIKTSRNYIERYLSLNKGMVYNQLLLNDIPSRLREIPFASVIKPYEIGMRKGKADVYLYLDNRKASNLDGVLGIQPDNVTGDVVVTGDVQFNIMNGLKQGETINLRWQRLQTRTQQLDVRFEYPYILDTPIGTELKLNVYRQDTLFSQLNLYGALNYFFKGSNSIKLYIENAQSNVISAQAFDINRFADTRSNIFGAGFNVRSLDYRFNPRKGYDVQASVGAGYKKILINPAIDDSFYEGLDINTEIFNSNFIGREFLPVGKRSTVLLGLKGGAFINANMFRNESYRIGGLKSLRGFDEQSIFATSYAIGTLEYRYLLEQNSNLFLFFDQAYYEDRFGEEVTRDSPFGFGAGINFETRAGIFSLTYALGKQFDNPIDFRSSKIHFGFASFF
jgi:outer membrane protein assembly factor BamA